MKPFSVMTMSIPVDSDLSNQTTVILITLTIIISKNREPKQLSNRSVEESTVQLVINFKSKVIPNWFKPESIIYLLNWLLCSCVNSA